MGTVLDHTIVPVRDQEEAIEFYTRILGFEDGGRGGMTGLFAVAKINDSSALDFLLSDNIPNPGHYAFAMEQEQFARSFQRIKEAGIPYGDGPETATNMRGPGKSTGTKGYTQSVYFSDPSGHLLEIITYP